MNLIDQILTGHNVQPQGHTCGIACWTAQEDICRCSCGGVNHGCMRTTDGVQPKRSRKIKGLFYELETVVRGYDEARKFMEEHRNVSYERTNATEKEIQAYPELASFRSLAPYDRYMKPVMLYWVRTNKISMINLHLVLKSRVTVRQ